MTTAREKIHIDVEDMTSEENFQIDIDEFLKSKEKKHLDFYDVKSKVKVHIDKEIDFSVEDLALDDEEEMKPTQRAIYRTLVSAAQIASLMPTASLLAFQLVSPILSTQGRGDEYCGAFKRVMTAAVAALCGLSSVLMSFTDSVKGKNGNVLLGLATFRGLWIFGASTPLPPEIAEKYKLKFTDFVHAFLSCLVFAAAVMFDENIVDCFYVSSTSAGIKEEVKVFAPLPLGIGVICSILFLLFPTERRRIGFPVTDQS